jgi:hypothetical protein
MSTVENVQPNVPRSDIPIWDEKRQFFRMQAWFRFLVAVIVILWVVLIFWVLAVAPIRDAPPYPDVGTNVWIVLTPILIAGFLAEGLLGTTFYIIEGSWRTMVAYLGSGLRWLKLAEIEVMEARRWFADVSTRYSQEVNAIQLDSDESLVDLTKRFGPKLSAADELRQLAERRLARAEENLSNLVTYGSYKSAKAAATVILGLLIGVVMATLMQLQIFALLGVSNVPARMDVLVTGLIIGASIVPIRSILTNLGDLVNRVGSKML